MLSKIIKNLFLPTSKNNYRARLLHIDALSVFLLISIFLNLIIRINPNLSNVLGFATDITVEKILYYTNQKRKENGLPPLKLNKKLSEAAKAKALDMFAKNYWSHYAPDGKTPWEFILSAGYEYEYAGENLAKNFMFSKDVVEAWMRSKTHRENILKKEYTDIGLAVVNGVLNGEETTLVVQLFGKPFPKVQAKKTNFIKQVSAETKIQAPSVKTAKKQKISSNTSSNTKEKPVTKASSFNITLAFLSLLSLSLILDYYFAIKLKIIRNTSHNLLTFIFLFTIIIGLFIITKGNIL